jgi:hypothetical protein
MVLISDKWPAEERTTTNKFTLGDEKAGETIA